MNALVQYHRRSLTILFFFCFSLAASAQPKAGFSATPLAGCSPLVVYFFDSSTGNPTQLRWDLGNGVISQLRNPSATYFNPGTYTVRLIASNSKGADTVVKKEYITVYAAPVPDFGFNKSAGCFPLSVRFTDKSTTGSGTIDSWQWDFGDGTISTEKDPEHVYTSAGDFTVTLKVINSFGCIKSFTQTSAISVSNGVKAAFTNTNPGICRAPSSVQFTSSSTGPGPLSYQWALGDGSTSTAANPTHTYTTNGSYGVRLIVTSPQGCADTIKKDPLFRIGAALAAFTAPAGTCVNERVTFTNASPPTIVSALWNFGDGTTSTQLSPTKAYTVAGTYTVQLIANFGTCFDTVRKLFIVSSKPTADFTFTKKAFCNLPAPVQFASLASGAGLQYAWNFGDNTTATTSNPLHSYSKEGTYTVRLIVTGPGNCSDTVTKKDVIVVQRPRVRVEGLPQNGCAPVSINPTATLSTNEVITSYRWNFGDGTTSTLPAPQHTYDKAGTYSVSLIITTAEGCTDTTNYPSAVRVGDKPTADFTNLPKIVCPFEKVYFTNQSTGNADQWLWIFGDGGTSTEANPYHQYSDTGWQTVTLIAFNNTCPDTLVVKDAVYVNPPVSSFAVRNDCDDKYTIHFTDKSLGPKTWFWEFGDGDTSTEQSPIHTYQKAGTYDVKLTVTNDNCSHFSIRKVMVIDEKADFTKADSIICRNGTATFTTQGIKTSNISSWRWEYGDGNSSTDASKNKYKYTQSGLYIVTLTITDILGCKSSKSLPLKVFGPVAKFTPSVPSACLKDNVIQFNDASASDGNHPIVQWRWHYGDGIVDTSLAVPFQHSYNTAGIYTVKLMVTDAFGCTDSTATTVPLIIAQPVASFLISDSAMCTGKNIRFTNTSQASLPSYQWSFGDGGRSTFTNPTYAYPAEGVYSIKLVVTDRYGCKDSVVKPDLITISYPKAAMTVSDTIGTCPPLMVHFTNRSTNYQSILWDFGDGNTSRLLDTPSHFYATPGTFKAYLVASGPGGCTDTVRQTIVVKGPSGTLTYAPLTGCKPLTVNFTASTKNNASFIWDFSDGATVASKKDTISHTYTVAGDFVPRMILTDAGGCTVPVEGKDTIRVKGVVTDFVLDSATFCDLGTVQFNNQTVSNDFITGYHWNFGDGAVSTTPNPVHRYGKPGSYTVQLVVTTQSGCSDTRVLADTVKVYQSPEIKIAGDTAACAPATFRLRGEVITGNDSLLHWTWNLGNGEISAEQVPVPQLYAADGNYTVSTTVTDEHGCHNKATRLLSVFPVPQTEAGADQWICRGTAYQLKATGATTYQWAASPSLSCNDCAGPLAAPADSTQYMVTGFNSFGCSRTDSVTIRVHQPFTLQVEKGDTICVGKTVKLAASGADQYTWTPSTGVRNTAIGTTTATPQASTQYKVVAKDNVGCFTDTGYVYIKVWPIPTIQTTAVQTLTVGGTLTLKPTYSTDVSSYQWSNAQTLSCATCPSPVAYPKTETKYTIDVKNDGGCTAKESITVQVICNNGNLFIPNTFSPNTDGHNDRFYPRGTGISSIRSLKVYNRWGEMVFSRENFSANDAAAGWDGTYKGAALTPDVFIYTCEVVCVNNEVLTFRGDVTLLR
jgi:gliding motility-associated-like protein